MLVKTVVHQLSEKVNDMADKPVTEAAARVVERLKTEGSMLADDVRLWLSEEGMEPRLVNMVLGQGEKRGSNRWHREGEMLIAGPRPGSKPGPIPRQPDHIPTLEEALDRPTLQGKFQGLLESLNVQESQAQAAATFCFGAFDMENPAEVWQALRECHQIGQPVIKKQIWRLWSKTLRIDPPEALVQEVKSWGSPPPPPPTQGGRKFFVMDGEIVPTTPDDPEGLTMADAARLVSIQRGKNSQEGEGHVVTTLLQQQGETDRKRMEIDAQKTGQPQGESAVVALINQQGEVIRSVLNKPADTSFEVRLDTQRREFEARMETQNQRFMDLMTAQGERHQHMLETVQLNNTHSMEMVKLAMEGNNNRPSFFDQLEEALSSKALEKFLQPPPAAPSMITGPSGTMTLDVYKAIHEMQFKSEGLSLAKQALPELFKMGGDIAEATRQLAASRGHTVEDESPKEPAERPRGPTYIHTTCVVCGQSMTYPASGEFLVCPYCRAPQTTDGRLMVPLERPEEPDQDFDETISAEASGQVPQEVPDAVPHAGQPSEPSTTQESPFLLGSYVLVAAARPAPEEPEEPKPELAPATASSVE